jgi:hypothetical protein
MQNHQGCHLPTISHHMINHVTSGHKQSIGTM